MEVNKLIEVIDALDEFNEKDHLSSVSETIEILKDELNNRRNYWKALINHITQLVNESQELANQYDCELKVRLFSHGHYEELGIVVKRGSYSCEVFEINNESVVLITEIERFLKNRLKGILTKISDVMQ